jgi:microcin C transport system substrate-binding protein
MKMLHRHLTLIAASTLLLAASNFFTGCGGGSVVEERDHLPNVRAYWEANPEFFRFRTLADLPDNLIWEDGSDLPDIGSQNARKGGVEKTFMQDFPRTFRLIGPDANSSFRPFLLDDVQFGLLSVHPNVRGAMFPALAESWARGDDGRTVYFRLREGLTWSDGEPITVEDFFFMFYFYRSPWILAPWYNDYATRLYTGIAKYDDRTLSVTYHQAKPDILYRTGSVRPIPMHFYKEFGEDFVERYQWRFEPTTGPYILNERDVRRGRSVTLRRNNNWWGRDLPFMRNRFNVDEIRIEVIRHAPNSLENFRSGEIDIIGLSLPDWWHNQMPNDHELVRNGFIHKTVFYNQIPRPSFAIRMNSHQSLLNNQDIRIGLNYALNWDMVIEQVFRGDFVRMRTTVDGYGPVTHPELTARQFSVRNAESYFAKAGFNQRNRDGILENAEGQRLSFTLTFGSQLYADAMNVIQQQARRAGVNLNLEMLDGTAAWKKVQEKNHELAFTAFATSVEDYPRFWEPFHSDNAYDRAFFEDGSINPNRQVKVQTNNLTMTANWELDQLIMQYDNSADMDEITELAHRIQEILHDDAAFNPAFVMPFYRVGYWRWVQWPEDFNVMQSRSAGEFHVHWIDEDMRRETLAARRAGQTFPAKIQIFDRYRDEFTSLIQIEGAEVKSE